MIPITDAILVNNIPVINTKCVGLNRPSRPYVSCHQKSNGPAIINKNIPSPEKSFGNFRLKIFLFFMGKNNPTKPLIETITPAYKMI